MSNTITKTLPCRLTDREILEKSAAASGLYKERNAKEAELKSVSSAFKEDIKELNGHIGRLQHEIYNKEEYRPVECGWYINRKDKIKLLKRLDTMEVVETQGLSQAELQENFFDDETANIINDMQDGLGEGESITFTHKDKSVKLKGKRPITDELPQ